MCWTQFKKLGPLSENSSPYLVSQAGYGPMIIDYLYFKLRSLFLHGSVYSR